MSRKANEFMVIVYRPLEIYSGLGLEYLIILLMVSWMVRGVETQMDANVQLAWD